MTRLPFACLALSMVLTLAADVRAFCRARTCEPSHPTEDCGIDDHGCTTVGRLLRWNTGCVTFAVQKDGSHRSGIDIDSALDASSRALAAWLLVDCAGKKPSLTGASLGPVTCDESRYDPNGGNANIVIFRDDDWPYPGGNDLFATTVVRFDPATGEILDADIEINTATFLVSATGGNVGVDLQSILSHEFGHFLGLAHSGVDTTMQANWDGVGTALRSLSEDDAAGMCDAYPPGREARASCTPGHGFSSECAAARVEPGDAGCMLAHAPHRREDGSAPAIAIVLAFGVALRRAGRVTCGRRCTGFERMSSSIAECGRDHVVGST